jgi:hypothetical protein
MGFSISVGVCGDDMEAGSRIALRNFLKDDTIHFVPPGSAFLNFFTEHLVLCNITKYCFIKIVKVQNDPYSASQHLHLVINLSNNLL